MFNFYNSTGFIVYYLFGFPKLQLQFHPKKLINEIQKLKAVKNFYKQRLITLKKSASDSYSSLLSRASEIT